MKFDTNAVKDAIAARARLLARPLRVSDVPEPDRYGVRLSGRRGDRLCALGCHHELGYRLQVVGLEFTGSNATATTNAETDLLIHFLEIGVRYRF